MHLFRGYFSALLVAVAVALSALSVGAPAFAQVSPQSIVVQGAGHTDAATIRSYFTGTDQASVNRAVADLSATGMFSKVDAKIVGGQVVVSVVENAQIINRVAFEGNKTLKSDQLAVEVQSKGHTGFDEAKAKADVERLKDAYRKIGRSATQVSYRLVQLPNGRVDLVFTVNEGDKTGVREIKFVGNHAVSSYRLHSLMQTTEMNWLSWFKNSDVYDPDRLASDQEAIRKYYMKNGYADFRITNTDVAYQNDPAGYVITISVDEGQQYRVSSVDVTSHVGKVDSASLKGFVTLHAGDVYNATEVEKTVDSLTREMARQGYAFSDVRPHGERDEVAHKIAVAFTVDDGPKVYIERIDVVGNTRTRDYVIRREFDIGEGDPYNHTLIERAERRLNRLGYFKKVHISTRPGSTPDRVIVTVEVEDQPTGSVSLSGGYSTTAGFLAEVAFTENNFLGRGQYVKASVSEGQYSRGWGLSFTEPYFLDQRLAAGFDIYHKEQDENAYALYATWTTGVNLRLGVPVTDEFTVQPSYTLYQSAISIPNSVDQPFEDCPANGQPWLPPGFTTPQPSTATSNCLLNGEASVAIKQAAALGAITTSAFGYSLIWDTIDDRKNPTSGAYLNFHQDVAGAGGYSRFIRETFDGKYYYPITDDLVGFLRLQGGDIRQFGGGNLPLVDNFNLGPTLVRGFAPGGIGPRDISDPNNIAGNGLGGTTYFGGTAEVQFPLFGLPREIGLKGAVFADAGTLFGYQGQTNFSTLFGEPAGTACWASNSPTTKTPYIQSNCVDVDDEMTIRSSIGASLIWQSPLGPIRIDYAYAVTKGKYDQLQQFNFTGGANF
ncbi:MAG TPA: outer membrane protein assembly factor BamA [Roseiarcus sp.]|jgi:outer membrane protein insertion porin family